MVRTWKQSESARDTHFLQLQRTEDGTSQETERKRASKKHSLARTECETLFSGSPCRGVDVRVWWNRGTATVDKTCLYVKVCRSRVRRSARCVTYCIDEDLQQQRGHGLSRHGHSQSLGTHNLARCYTLDDSQRTTSRTQNGINTVRVLLFQSLIVLLHGGCELGRPGKRWMDSVGSG